MEYANKTSQDAYARVVNARTGSTYKATEGYLCALEHYVNVWAEELKADRLARIQMAERKAHLAELEASEVD